MKNLSTIAVFLLSVAIIASCQKNENNTLPNEHEVSDCNYQVEEPGIITSFIHYDTLLFNTLEMSIPEYYDAQNNGYYNIDSIIFIVRNNDANKMIVSRKSYINNIDSTHIEFLDDTAMTNLFYKYKKTWGDTIYKGDYCSTISHCITDTIDYINITCNKDWDNQHTAGALLNDILKIECTTGELLTEKLHIKDMKLEQFNNENHYMVNLDFINLHFTSAPEKTDAYSFFLEYKTTGGKTIKQEILYETNIIGGTD